jgi:peroxiredoxin
MMIDRVAEEDGMAIDFLMLTDTEHRVIDRYGLYNPDEPKHRPVPHPATYVIDRDGVVRFAFVEVNYRVRAENETILSVLAELDM